MPARLASRSPERCLFRPQLETLEERTCPSCSVTVLGGHIIQIVEARDSTGTARCNGQVPQVFRGIDQLHVDTGAGFDTVSFLTQGEKVKLLTSIFVSGIGELTLLDLVPLGALDMAQSVHNDRGGSANDPVSVPVNGLRSSLWTLTINTPVNADIGFTFHGPGSGPVEMGASTQD